MLCCLWVFSPAFFALRWLAFELKFLRADDEDEDGGEAGPKAPGHYKLET